MSIKYLHIKKEKSVNFHRFFFIFVNIRSHFARDFALFAEINLFHCKSVFRLRSRGFAYNDRLEIKFF